MAAAAVNEDVKNIWGATRDTLISPLPAKHWSDFFRILFVRLIVRYVFTYAMLATLLTVAVAVVMAAIVYYSLETIAS